MTDERSERPDGGTTVDSEAAGDERAEAGASTVDDGGLSVTAEGASGRERASGLAGEGDGRSAGAGRDSRRR